METNEPSQASDDFDYLGHYSPADSAKLFEAFEAAGIDYAGEVVGAAGRNPPVPYVLISFDPSRREDVDRIHKELFGDCLPNYDSSFFKEQQNLDPDERAPRNET